MAAKYDWDNIKKEYITGNITYEKLCEKYGIKRRKTLEERASKEKWGDLRGEYRGEIQKISLEREAKKKAKAMEKAEKKVSKVCDKLLDTIFEMADKVKKAGDVKSLTSALTDVQKMKGIKSEDDRKEQAARIKALLQSVERNAETGPQTVKVIIEGSEEYAE